MNDIIIKKQDLGTFVKNGKDFVFKQEAEKAIIALLDYKEQIEKAIEEIKKGIEEAGKKVSPDFKGVIGAKIKAVYRLYGERYGYDKNKKEKLIDFLKSITFYRVDSEKVDKYAEEEGKIPDGIKLKERQPKISFTKVQPQLEDGKEEEK